MAKIVPIEDEGAEAEPAFNAFGVGGASPSERLSVTNASRPDLGGADGRRLGSDDAPVQDDQCQSPKTSSAGSVDVKGGMQLVDSSVASCTGTGLPSGEAEAKAALRFANRDQASSDARAASLDSAGYVDIDGRPGAEDAVGGSMLKENSAECASVSVTSDMDLHGGSKTSLLHPHEQFPRVDEMAHGRPACKQDAQNEENSGAGCSSETPESERGSDGQESVHVDARFMRRGTRGPIRHASNERPYSSGERKPFCVPQAMFMGHPVGSEAAEFLERQKRRIRDVRARRETISGLLKLVMNHDTDTKGERLPDIDAVFPAQRPDRHQGD